MRVPETAKRSTQSTLKEINSEYSWEGLMLELKLQYFGHLMRRANSLDKTQILGKIKGEKRRWRQRMKWLDGITNSVDVKFEHTQGDSGRQGSLAWNCSWGQNFAKEQQQQQQQHKLFTNIMAFLTTLSMGAIHMSQLFKGTIDTLIKFCGNNFFLII